MKALCVASWVLAASWCLPVAATSHGAPNSSGNTRLLVGIPAGLPGYEIAPDNTLKIADPYKRAVTDCIATRLNANFVWMAYPTKRIIQMLQAKELDMIYPMGFTEDRAAILLQSTWTWQNPDTLVTLHPVDLSDKSTRMAARLGSPQHTDYVAEGYGNFSAVYAYDELPKMLGRGMVDVVIVPRSVFLDQKPAWPAKVMATTGKPRASGFYLNRDDPKGLQKPLSDSIARCRDVEPAK